MLNFTFHVCVMSDAIMSFLTARNNLDSTQNCGCLKLYSTRCHYQSLVSSKKTPPLQPLATRSVRGLAAHETTWLATRSVRGVAAHETTWFPPRTVGVSIFNSMTLSIPGQLKKDSFPVSASKRFLGRLLIAIQLGRGRWTLLGSCWSTGQTHVDLSWM